MHQVEDVEDVVVDPAERESNEPTLIIHDSKLIIDTMVFEIKVARGKKKQPVHTKTYLEPIGAGAERNSSQC